MSPSVKFLGGFVAAALVLIGVFVAWPTAPAATRSQDDITPPLSPAVQELLNEARSLHARQSWCAARDAWQTAYDAIPPGEEFGAYHAEIDRNRRVAEERCESKTPLIDEKRLVPLPEQQRPALVPADRIVRFYPVGRTTKAVGTFDITGEGTSVGWLLKSEGHFAYRYQVPVETEVTSNDGQIVVFEQRFGDVAQLLAVSDEELSLKPPEDASALWELVDTTVEQMIPQYRVFKKFADALETLDPEFKRTLTSFKDALGLSSQTDVEIAVQFEQWAGQRFELTYESGFGVTRIRDLSGNKYAPDDLERLGRNSSLLMDFFLSEVADLRDGQQMKVSTRDVQAMLDFGYDTDAAGVIELRRDRSIQQEGEKLVQLETVAGEVDLRANVDGIERSGSVRIQSGNVLYSPTDYLVRQADLSLDGDVRWVTAGHLLYGAKTVNVRVDCHYRAKRSDTRVVVHQEN